MNDKLQGERELVAVKIRALGHARLMHESDTQKELLCFYPQDFEAAVKEVLCRAALASDAQPQAPKVPDTAELIECLELAQNGLRWYQAEHPEHQSEADEELHMRIDAAIASAKREGKS